MRVEVQTQNVDGQVTALGSAGPFTLVVNRPVAAAGITLHRVQVRVRGDFAGAPMVSGEIAYEVEVAGDASAERLRDKAAQVDAIAEIPNSLRHGTAVRLVGAATIVQQRTVPAR